MKFHFSREITALAVRQGLTEIQDGIDHYTYVTSNNEERIALNQTRINAGKPVITDETVVAFLKELLK